MPEFSAESVPPEPSIDPAAAISSIPSGLLGQLLDPNLRFPVHPRFVPDFDVFDMPDGLGIQFRGAETPVLLRGREIGPVVAYLRQVMDGSRSVGDLLRGAPVGVARASLVRALLVMHSKGVLTAAETAASRSIAADVGPGDEQGHRELLFWGRQLSITRSAATPAEVVRRFAAARLVVVGAGMFGSVTVDLLRRSGAANVQMLCYQDEPEIARVPGDPAPGDSAGPNGGVRTSVGSSEEVLGLLRDYLPNTDLLITATCDAPRALFRDINDLSMSTMVPWLRANSDGSAFDLGPLVLPHDSGCFTCLELRTQSAQDLAIEEELYQERLADRPASMGGPLLGEAVWVSTLAAGVLVGEAFRFLTGIAPATLTDSVLRLLPVTGTFEHNSYLRVPRCPSCYRGDIPAAEIDLGAVGSFDGSPSRP
jgi:bacteriocin biosynthesis cyclodehydratase domain-containing protein